MPDDSAVWEEWLEQREAELDELYSRLDLENHYFAGPVQVGPARLKEDLLRLRAARASLADVHQKALRFKDRLLIQRQLLQAVLEGSNDVTVLGKLSMVRIIAERAKVLLAIINARQSEFSRSSADIALAVVATNLELRIGASIYKGIPHDVDPAEIGNKRSRRRRRG
jgi:hypothetical protein